MILLKKILGIQFSFKLIIKIKYLMNYVCILRFETLTGVKKVIFVTVDGASPFLTQIALGATSCYEILASGVSVLELDAVQRPASDLNTAISGQKMSSKLTIYV
jgi:hypothetical protein